MRPRQAAHATGARTSRSSCSRPKGKAQGLRAGQGLRRESVLGLFPVRLIPKTALGPEALALRPSCSGTLPASALRMKYLKLYLVGYFVLLVGAVLALWQARVLDDIPPIWLG